MKLQEIDKNHLWHPLTQHQLYPDHIAIDKAEGVLLFDTEGNQYIDAISSWYTCMYGHCNPYITEKVSAQMKKLDHVVFTGFTHQPAVELANKLISILPKNQQKLFFSDNGSTSVDIAIKMALQYHFNKGEKKQKIIAFEDGFHGDTFGAMSVSGLSIYNGSFEDYFLQVERIPTPNKNNFQEVKNLLLKHSKTNDIAAFIYEPLVQGAAAMQMHKPEHLNELIEIAKNHNIITIADEVMTGFGRTGEKFGYQHWPIEPDILVGGKGLAGGYAPLGGVFATEKIGESIEEAGFQVMFTTFGAHPSACAAATEVLEIICEEDLINSAKTKGEYLINRLEDSLSQHPNLAEVRGRGLLAAVELVRDRETLEQFPEELAVTDKIIGRGLKEGVFFYGGGTGTIRDVVCFGPPFTVSESQLDRIVDTFVNSVNDVVDLLP